MTKNLLASLLFLTVLMSNTVFAAVDCNTVPVEADGGIPAEYLVCPIKRFFNASVLLSGVFLVVLILMGVIKLTTALGNPEGMKGATMSWTFALYGFLVIVGFAAIYTIVVTSLGLEGTAGVNSLPNVFNTLETKVTDFLQFSQKN